MMRSVVLAPVLMVMLGAAAAPAQYDFYEFMNSAGYAPAPSAPINAPDVNVPSINAPNMSAPSLNAPWTEGAAAHTSAPQPPWPTELVSLDDLEMIENPDPAAEQLAQAQSPAEVAPSVVAPSDGSEQAAIGMSHAPMEFGYSAPQAYVSGPELPCADGGCGNQGHGWGHRHIAGHGGHAELMPYRQPILPPPSTLYGYFNSPPCYAHLWDSYPQEAAARCARLHHATRAYQPRQGVRGELVEPCH